MLERRMLSARGVTGMKKWLALVLVLLCLAPFYVLNIGLVKSEFSGRVTITSDGSVDPPAAPIQRDGDVYTFTGNINGYLVVEKGNIVIDGAGYTLQGSGSLGSGGYYEIGPWTGIYLQNAVGVTIQNLHIQNFRYGINHATSDANHSANTTITGNYIVYNQDGILKASNCTITGNYIAYNENGIYCTDTVNKYNTIVGNTIACNSNGINFMNLVVTSSTNNIIAQNNIVGNNMAGIHLAGSWGNLILENNITGTIPGIGGNISAQIGAGLVLAVSSQNNRVIGNNISGNRYGIFFGSGSSNNVFYKNSFDNSQQISIASQQSSSNGTVTVGVLMESWDDASVGNYWSDYTGKDYNEDGIGDTPYIIDANNKDNYPIVHLSAYISISTSTSATTVGSAVNINGRLYDPSGDPLQNELVVLSYTFAGANSSFPISSSSTDEAGNYNMQWIANASGTFTLEVSWSGNSMYAGARNSTTLSLLPYENEQLFFVESNSTVTTLAFNSTSSELSFSVSGPSNTTGYVKATIAKSLIQNGDTIRVYLDGNELNYSLTLTANSWLLEFTYSHSTHQVSVHLAANMTSSPLPAIDYWMWGVLAIAIAVFAFLGAAVWQKKKHTKLALFSSNFSEYVSHFHSVNI
jgi:parallel beta-helix repeat protein